MRNVLAAAALSALTLVSVASATGAEAAAETTKVKISKKAPIEIDDSNFTQIAVSLKVTCDPAQQPQLSFNVLVTQGSVQGFAFVPSVPCTGKGESVVAHPQSNFGSTFSPGTATVAVVDFVNNLTFPGTVTIG